VTAAENATGAESVQPEDSAEIARLAELSPLAYEREPDAAAERLGCRVSILDRLVNAERGNGGAADTGGRGRPHHVALIRAHWRRRFSPLLLSGRRDRAGGTP
jgi:hypothetical protein